VSLTELEYVEQEKSLGRRLHFNDGVWWEQQGPLYCRPAYRFKKIVPGKAKPGTLRRWLPHSHVVPERAVANRTLTYYAITRPSLSQYAIETLGASKRKSVRRGISRCDVRIMEPGELDRHKDDVREIALMQATRQQRDGFGLPPKYYDDHFEDWWRDQTRTYRLPGRDLWGAFISGKLVGYLLVELVEEVADFTAGKCNTEYSACCPWDALYYKAICALRDDPRCEMLVNGGPCKASLAAFKEQHLFRLTDVPVFTQGLGLYRLATGVSRLGAMARQRVRRRASPVSGGGSTHADVGRQVS